MPAPASGCALLCLLAALGLGCRGEKPREPSPDVAASSPYLETAAREFLTEGAPVVRLVGPGCCPGHFDITPGQVARLRRCRVLLRFDFQQDLDGKLRPAAADGLRIVAVSLTGGLCEPDSYLSACRQVAEGLVAGGLLDRPAAEATLAAAGSRLRAGAAEALARARRAGLDGLPVLASGHQVSFCKWLGLEVVGSFSAGDNPGELDEAVRVGRAKGVRLVIGNVPEGRVIPDRLAGALGAGVVMFDNFPAPGAADAFDLLLAANVDKLIRAGGRP